MADKTIGELKSVPIGDLAAAPDIYDNFKMPGEIQGDAVHITGAQFKKYAQSATKSYAEAASASAATAEGAKTVAQSALAGVRSALNNLPAGATLVINDLTTGGTSAALSAEMGRVLARRPNPTLVHNGFFAGCVNQRGQEKYSGAVQYTIDRWMSASQHVTVSVSEGGVTVSATSSLGNNSQMFAQKLGVSAAGKTVTASVLVTECSGVFRLYIGNTASGTGRIYSEDISAPGLYTVTGVMATGITEGFGFQKRTAEAVSFSVTAVKLELGDTQTLAHEEDGSWVLNEVPDYSEELAKCQRYYQLFSSESARPTELADYRPSMRANPAVGTININGVTYYYADAEI